MYGDMAALARISVTDQSGNSFTVRAKDVKRAFKSPGLMGITFLEMDWGEVFQISETPTAVHNAIDTLWTDWLGAFPA